MTIKKPGGSHRVHARPDPDASAEEQRAWSQAFIEAVLLAADPADLAGGSAPD